MTYRLSTSTLADAISLAQRMRKVDVDEVWASIHQTPLEALQASILGSRDPITVIANNSIICMCGVGMTALVGNSRRGFPWLLASDDFDDHAKHLIRASRRWLNIILPQYDLLENYVDARNEPALKWLRWLGFTVEPAAPFGVEHLPFHRFWMRGPDHV